MWQTICHVIKWLKPIIYRSFQTHFEESIKIHPDPTTIYCLGVWHFKFSDLPWYQRQAAEIFFAKVPKSDFETALSYFLQAERIQPGFYSKNQVSFCTLWKLNPYPWIFGTITERHFWKKYRNTGDVTVGT